MMCDVRGESCPGVVSFKYMGCGGRVGGDWVWSCGNLSLGAKECLGSQHIDQKVNGLTKS